MTFICPYSGGHHLHFFVKKKVVQSQHKLGQKKEIHKNLYINLLQRNIKNNTKDGSEAHLQWQDNFQIQKFKMVKPKIESPN